MLKIKGIVAAIAAVTSISALGIAASASTNAGDYFSFSFTAGGSSFYSTPSDKTDSWTDKAVVTPSDGNLSTSRPMYFSVYSTDTEDSTYELTYETKVETCNGTKCPITYRGSGDSKQDLYLHGRAGTLSARASGVWAP